MLSDKFVQEDLSSNENLSKQIIRLEELSISMTSLIESGNSHKIAHLEKIRQKILKDIIKNKKPISTNDKPRVSNIFFLNDKHILISLFMSSSLISGKYLKYISILL